MSAPQNITNGPGATDIFTSACYANRLGWDLPLTFEVEGKKVTFTWVNGPTWMADRPGELAFDLKLGGESFCVFNYNPASGTGIIYNPKPSGPTVTEVITHMRQAVVDRISGVVQL